MIQMKNNHLRVDIGIHGTHHNTREMGGKVFSFDTTYNGHQYIRRSGIVTALPRELTYTVPFNLDHKLKHIKVELGDTVFFDPRAFEYCERNGLIDKTGSTWSYIMPYRYLICAIKKGTERIQMLNGRVLVKMRHDIKKDIGIYQQDVLRTESAFRYAEITHVDNNEGYEAFAYDVYKFDHFEYSRQTLEVGNLVVLNKYADFDLQSIFQEVTQHDELEKSFVVNRHDIVCYQKSGSDKLQAYGFWTKIEPVNEDLTSVDTLYIPNKKVAKNMVGIVLEKGCGVGNTFIGASINFKDKAEVVIEDELYVHREWIVLSE